jgi:hypothetical protein
MLMRSVTIWIKRSRSTGRGLTESDKAIVPFTSYTARTTRTGGKITRGKPAQTSPLMLRDGGRLWYGVRVDFTSCHARMRVGCLWMRRGQPIRTSVLHHIVISSLSRNLMAWPRARRGAVRCFDKLNMTGEWEAKGRGWHSRSLSGQAPIAHGSARARSLSREMFRQAQHDIRAVELTAEQLTIVPRGA